MSENERTAHKGEPTAREGEDRALARAIPPGRGRPSPTKDAGLKGVPSC